MKAISTIICTLIIINTLVTIGCDGKNGNEPEPIASLCVSPITLIINEAKETGIFEVWNCGEPGSTLNYTINESCDWLFIDPTSGTSTGEHDDIILTVNFSSFSCDETRNCTIYVSGAGDTKTVTVTAIAKPCNASLCVSPTSLIINEPTTTGTFEVWNCGDTGSNLTYSITESCNWLSVNPTSGTSTGEHDDIAVTVNFESFSSGETKTCEITVSGANDIETVTVVATAEEELEASLCVRNMSSNFGHFSNMN
ncbi:MAG: BACON domain-containing protein [Candidatus Cloacimonetes bacterium]|nr:BACON domain-containing protein [Candidatus Cloacimonadota bacterium]MBL7086802.1 BACON domain-containing protein [Candidatus Cloacimonadota bacterium]